MKKLILSIVAIAAISLSSFGQAPQGFKYQAVVRDAGNLILNNQAVGMQLMIQQGSIGGTAVYTETFAPTTNAYGLVNLEIGSGTVVSGDFTTIDWANGPYFMETAVDATGGTSYVVMGTSQLMSVPFALYAKTAENTINDSDWTVDGSGNMVNANSGTVSIEVDATVNGVTVGRGAGNIATNTALGTNALSSNTTGDGNTANGYLALTYNTTGDENTANGSLALSSNTTGFRNTANGYQALASNTTGYYNTANGGEALFSNTTGYYNTANGNRALYSNTTGWYNTANGYQALYDNLDGYNNTANGATALYSNTTGFYNTANGYQALYLNTTGNSNTAIGCFSDVIVGNLQNATVIGFDALVSASNTVVVGNTSVTSIGGQVGWTTLSDARFKKNIRKDEVRGLEFITGLTPVTYNYDIRARENWKETNYGEKNTAEWEGKYDIEKLRMSGFIAQDVEALAKEIGYDFSSVDAPKNDKDFYGLRYAEFVVPLVKAVQELNEELQTKSDEISILKKENELMRAGLEQIEQQQELIQALSTELEQIKAHLNLQTKK